MRAFLRRLTGNAAEADDLAQITFMKAFEKQDKLADTSAAKSWLFQIAYRCFLDSYRRTARRQDLSVQRIEDDPPETNPSLRTDIAKAMDSLPAECRAVVILCLAHGLTHKEAAEITKLSLGTVKSHTARGKTKLRAFLHAYEASK